MLAGLVNEGDVDNFPIPFEHAEEKRSGQALAHDSEEEKDKKKQVELDEILIQEAQLTEDAVSLPFVEATMQDLESASIVIDP